jgi:hypothetical protein
VEEGCREVQISQLETSQCTYDESLTRHVVIVGILWDTGCSMCGLSIDLVKVRVRGFTRVVEV